MSKFLMLVYALIGYVVGLASIAYIIGFLADFGVPKSIGDDEANSTWPLPPSTLVWSACSGCIILRRHEHHSSAGGRK